MKLHMAEVGCGRFSRASPRSVILDWLHGINDFQDPPQKKRRRMSFPHTRLPITPPISSISTADLNYNATTKREGTRKRPHACHDLDQTPQGPSLTSAKRSRSKSPQSIAQGSTADDYDDDDSNARSRTTSNSTSRLSGKASPLRQIAALRIQPEPVIMRALTSITADIPQALNTIRRQMELTGSGYAVLSLRGMGIEDASQLAELDIPPFAVAESPGAREAIGPIPSIQAASDLVSDAVRCQEAGFDEHGWNLAVHYPLINLALGLPRRPGRIGLNGNDDMGVDLIPW